MTYYNTVKIKKDLQSVFGGHLSKETIVLFGNLASSGGQELHNKWSQKTTLILLSRPKHARLGSIITSQRRHFPDAFIISPQHQDRVVSFPVHRKTYISCSSDQFYKDHCQGKWADFVHFQLYTYNLGLY